VAQRRDLELTDFKDFSDLWIQWINIPTSTSFALVRSSEVRQQQGTSQKSHEACRRWNDHRCPNTAASCNYAHVCSTC
ncbi:hypothetical protein L208DRAFT_1275587, partial [Tricholoma matsutake]